MEPRKDRKASLLLPSLLLILLTLGTLLVLYPRLTSKKTPSPQKEEVVKAASPERVSEEFYKWYIACLEELFKKSPPGSLEDECSWKRSEYVSDKLVDNIEKAAEERKAQGIETAGGKNPILCAQDIPDISQGGIVVELAGLAANKATIKTLSLYSWKTHPVEIELEKIDEGWKIVNILCPE